MFENIIGQQKSISQLKQQFVESSLPPAVLFHGPPYSGKLSAALELARGLACTAVPAGAWGCTCPSCVQHRRLGHPQTLMAGSRYFVQDIAACAEAMRSASMDATVYLFLRSVQKLQRRFDPVLWEGEESRLSKVMSSLESIRDDMEGIEPGRELPEPPELDKRINRVLDSAAKVASSTGSDNIPIHVIRNISYWARLSSPEKGKIVILENADRMHDGSRNALLKILEEPPEGVYFILLSSNQAAMPATVRSRLRPYGFAERTEQETAVVLQKIFRESEPHHRSIRQYMMQNSLLSKSGFDVLAHHFLELVVAEPEEQPKQTLEEITTELSSSAGREGYRYFFEELLAALRRILLREHGDDRTASLPLSLLEVWNREIARHQRYIDTLFMRPDTVLQSLCLVMRERHAKVH